MIELHNDGLRFSFGEVHPKATLSMSFQRTLRIPDGTETYYLPPGLGRFPLRHVDDFAATVPRDWLLHGGVMFPMYQAEAMWISLSGWYPMAVKIATGKVNAVSGKAWKNRLNRKPQDYVVVPEQPWLDGYCVGKGVIRQFVAMPLGLGATAEEQVTGQGEHGGIQLIVYPMKRRAYERYFPPVPPQPEYSVRFMRQEKCMECEGMGLAPGGRMKQEVYQDEYEPDDWDLEHGSRCFVHICNSMLWHQVTGEYPPSPPPTAKDYTDAGLPWFDYYDEKLSALPGGLKLQELKSVGQLSHKKKPLLPENQKVPLAQVNHVASRQKSARVREWAGGVVNL